MIPRPGNLLALLFCCPLVIATPTNFQHWFPQWRDGLRALTDNECNWAFKYYLNGSNPYCIPKANGVPDAGCIAGHIIDCMLSNMKESWKANMAAGAVVLGLLPTILALAGSNTIELGLLCFRRPLLAFLLGLGTPAIMPIRTFDYRNPAELLQKRQGAPEALKASRPQAKIIVALQYILTCAALANVAHTTWQLTLFTVISFAPATQFLPSMWVVLAIVIHMFGTTAIALRMKLTLRNALKPKTAIKKRFHEEFNLCAHHSKAQLTLHPETNSFILFSWLTSMGTILHIIFGTLVFSSMLFIASGDAVIVVGRLLASTAVCRVILMFEISGMRQVVDTQ